MNNTSNAERLMIVMPAYNESANIEHVVTAWHDVAKKISPSARLVIIDDGSTDATYEKLTALKDRLPQLIALTKPNAGHGATLYDAYYYALEHGADYIFQTDSDGQTDPADFALFWAARRHHDAILGDRHAREDGLSRIVVTRVLRLIIHVMFGVYVKDANTPFRLMRRDLLERHLKDVPKNYHLTNALLATFFVRSGENIIFFPITFRQRQGGKNSIRLPNIAKIGLQTLRDFHAIRKKLAKKG